MLRHYYMASILIAFLIFNIVTSPLIIVATPGQGNPNAGDITMESVNQRDPDPPEPASLLSKLRSNCITSH